MTPQELDALWQRAQACESEGRTDDARQAYQQIIDASPRQFMVRVKLSELEQRAGHYRAARTHAIEAAAILRTTQRWEGLAYVTANLLLFDERLLVASLIASADWSDPRVLQQSIVLSQQLWLCGEDEAALRMLELVRQRGGRDARLSYSQAMAEQHLGRIDAATAAFEDAIRQSPGMALAHWSLAYHAPSAEPGTRIPRIRTALASTHDPMERAMLQYALYKELDDAGASDEAWQALDAAAATMRQQQGFPAHAHGGDRLARPWPAGHADEAVATPARTPIFIVGMPRTGTTLLSRIVGAHPQVGDAGELNALEQAIGDAIDGFVDLPLKPDELDRLAAVPAAQVAQGYISRTTAHYGASHTHLIDKNPANIDAVGVIAGAMPGAKVLCLVRAPMDACYSNLRQLFQNNAFPETYDQLRLADRYAEFRAQVAHWEAALPETFLAVDYERLVADPEGEAAKVMAFCGLSFDPAYVEITRNLSPSATASASQVREPIHDRAVGAWRRHADALAPMRQRLAEKGFAE